MRGADHQARRLVERGIECHRRLQEAAPGRRTKMPGVADNIIEGLTTFCVETQNTALAPAGAGVLKQVLDAYEGQVGANEECVSRWFRP